MKDKIKVVFFDIDGTLYDHQSYQIIPSSIKALKKLKAKGIKICIATGRPIEMMAQLGTFIKDMDFDYLITSNGQAIYKDDICLYQNYLDKQDIKTIVSIAKKYHMTLALFGDDFKIANKYNDSLYLSNDVLKMNYPKLDNLDDYVHKNISHAICYENIKKINYFEKELKATLTTFWNDEIFDFVPNNGVKVHGIKKVLEMLELSKDQAMAFGDGHNDIDMLSYIKYGIAMGNAEERLKEVAYATCENIDNDGIFKALTNYKII